MPKRYDCAMARASIQLLLDGRLSPDERRSLDSHCDACRACTQHLEISRRAATVAAAWARPTVSDDPGETFNARVLAAIARETPHAAPAPERISFAALAFALCSIALGCACLAFAHVSPPDWIAPAISLQSALPSVTGGAQDFTSPAAGALDSLTAAAQSIHLPQWLTEAAIAALLMNVWFAREALKRRRMVESA